MKKLTYIFMVFTILLSFPNVYAKGGFGKGFKSYKSYKYSVPKYKSQQKLYTEKKQQKQNMNKSFTQRKKPLFFQNPIFKWLIGGMIFGAILSFLMGYGFHFGAPGILEILLIAGILYFFFKKVKKHKTYKKKVEKNRSNIQEAKQEKNISSYIDEKSLKKTIKNMYITLQKEWSKGDLITVKNFLTENLYNHLEMELIDLTQKGLINVIKDIKVNNIDIIHMEDLPDGNKLVVAEIEAEMINYITDSNGKLISGNPETKMRIKEYWSVVGRPFNWKVDNIKQI